MLVKECPKCEGKSYSSTDEGTWHCPYCNEDLTYSTTKLA